MAAKDKTRTDECVPSIVESFTTSTNGWLRADLVRLMPRAPAESVVPTLIESLGDQDDAVVRASCRTLGHFGEEAESAIPALIQVGRDVEAQSARTSRTPLTDGHTQAVVALGCDRGIPVGSISALQT